MTALNALLDTPWLLIGAMSVLGLLIGSFLNVVIHRLPLMMEREWRSDCHALLELPAQDAGEPLDLLRPRSRCPQCKTSIPAWRNVPILSFMLLGGRCAACRAPIARRYPVIEAVAGLAGGLCAWYFATAPGTPAGLLQALCAAALVWSLIALAVIDLDTRLLPDSITLPLLWAGIGCALFGIFPLALEDAVVGAIAGYGGLWAVYWLFKLATGKEGMGYGDFKLLAALGAWLGWQALPGIILLSSAVGAVVGVTLIVAGRHARTEPIPFGPFLAAAGILALFGLGDVTQWFGAAVTL